MTDLDAARTFVHAHARLVDRRRLQQLMDGDAADLVVAAVAAYRNADGGFGCLDPDVRSPASQPIAVRYAFDLLTAVPGAEAAARELGRGALDWLVTVTATDGGVPFLLPSAAGLPTASWMVPSAESSLLATVQLAAAALRLGLDHPWLGPAQDYCWDRIRTATPGRDAYAFKYAVDFLDATPERGRADAVLAEITRDLPPGGRIPVAGGIEGEELDPLAVAPWPDHLGARLFSSDVLGAALDRLEAGQQDDGGWDFGWDHWNPAAVWETRGSVTVDALQTLRAYGRTSPVG